MTILRLPKRLQRPMPPIADLIALGFRPAPDLTEWMRQVFIVPGALLYNIRYEHLEHAAFGCLWTSAPNTRGQRRILGQTEKMPPQAMGKWQKARAEQQMVDWFGDVPDFLLTFDAYYADMVDDASWCALVEHELHHCGQERDECGAPKFTQDGRPKFQLIGHDVEEFVGVVERYGAEATGVAELVRVANAGPTVAAARISIACGTCADRRRA